MNHLSKPSRLLFLDCQTTGARPDRGHLLEIAWAMISDTSLLKGGMPSITAHLCRLPAGEDLPAAIARLTGIGPQDMAQAEDPAHVATALAALVVEADAAVIHYASFESPFLNHLWQEHWGQDFPLPLICTHKAAKTLFPSLPSRSIRALAGYFGWPLHEAKRAGEHVEGTVHIARALLDEIKNRGSQNPWQDLLACLTTTSKLSRKKTYPLDQTKRLALPHAPGVYLMKNRRSDVLYVGKATSLHARVNSYFRGQKGRDPRKQEMLTQVVDIEVRPTASAIEAALLENELIKSWRPPYNTALKDRGKTIYTCDRNLQAMNPQASYAYGPFAHRHLIELMHFLTACAGDADTALSFSQLGVDSDHITPLRAAIKEGLQRELGATCLADPRALLAWGLRSLRAKVREDEALAMLDEDEGESEGDNNEGMNDEREDDGKEAIKDELKDNSTEAMNDEGDEGDAENDDVDTWDAEDWVAFLLGGLRQAARQVIRSRWLKRLADSDIYIEEPQRPGRYLRLRHAQLYQQDEARDNNSFPPPQDLPWEPLTPLSYDRLSVLLQECIILARKGGKVMIRDSVGQCWQGQDLRAHYARFCS